MIEIPDKIQDYLSKVEFELGRYEHPLFQWQAHPNDNGIDVVVTLKYTGIHDSPYHFKLLPREIEAQSFPWDFQRQLYNYLHDYLIEMFTRSPQIYEY